MVPKIICHVNDVHELKSVSKKLSKKCHDVWWVTDMPIQFKEWSLVNIFGKSKVNIWYTGNNKECINFKHPESLLSVTDALTKLEEYRKVSGCQIICGKIDNGDNGDNNDDNLDCGRICQCNVYSGCTVINQIMEKAKKYQSV